jgi:pseudouridine synthase
VRVNDAVVVELGTKVDPGTDRVSLDGTVLERPLGHTMIMLNKPPEVLVASRDARGRRTVMDLVAGASGRVFPVGRLDYRSEGLLLMTNDGDLAFRLAHPRFKVEKVYHVEVIGDVSPRIVRSLAEGVQLEDGLTQPARVNVVHSANGKTGLEIELREGRKRQIRRMVALFGLTVTRLVRVRFGPVSLAALGPGEWRPLRETEIRELRAAVASAGEAGAA